MNQLTLPMPERRFDGDTYDAGRDCERLTGALLRVYEALTAWRGRSGWLTLRQLAEHAGCSEASASARVRDLRKAKFGAHKIERTRLGKGLFGYRMAA